MTDSKLLAVAAGAAGAVGARALFVRPITTMLRRDLARINEGDYRPLLSRYADDAVLVLGDGEHRWAGEHRGKAAIERFLQDFVAAGIRGTLHGVAISGPPWALRMLIRFDDEAHAPDGEKLYENRIVLVIDTRWGRIVRHEDFYEDTGRMGTFDRRLRELGVRPVAEREAVPA